MKGFPNSGQYIGADEIFQNVFQNPKKDWSEWTSETSEFIDAGGTILVTGHYEGTFKESGIHMKAEFIHKFTIQRGLITKFHEYVDTSLIVNAMRINGKKKQLNNQFMGCAFLNKLSLDSKNTSRGPKHRIPRCILRI